MKRMRLQTVQLDRQEGLPMEDGDEGEDITTKNGDASTQPATHLGL